MENREKINRGIKVRLIVMSLATLLPVLLLVLFESPFFREKFVVYKSLVFLRYVFFALLEMYILFKIYRYIRYFKDSDYKERYILNKNDERNNFIRLKTDAMVIKIFIYICAIALITAGFFNEIVFYTLLVILLSVLITTISVYCVYRNKY